MCIVFVAVVALLLSSLAEAFSSPRLQSTPSAVVISNLGWRTGIDDINAGRRALIVVRTQTDENNEVDELETEASTTGLFIPGFSDQFAAKEEEAPIEKNITRKTKEQQQQQEAPPRPPSSSNKEKNTMSAFPELPKLSLPTLSFPNLNPFGGKKLVPTPPSMPPPRGSTEESIASAVGGIVAGSGLGLYADIFTDILSDTDLPSLVPPATLGVALGIGAYVGAGQRNLVGKSIRFIFGGPILGFRDNVMNAITRKIDEIKAAPGKFVDAVEQSIEDTVDEIRATPGKILDAVEKKIEDTVDDIKATPGKIADAVEQRIEDEVDAVMKRIDETVEEMKVRIMSLDFGFASLPFLTFVLLKICLYELQATPGKIADSIEEAIEVAVEDVVEAVEEVVSIPGKKLEEAQARLARITQAQTNVKTPTSIPPSLPIPTPPVQQQRSSFLPPADQKLELPSFTFPSVSPAKPAVVPAKSMPPPKEIPRIPFPPKVIIPERPKPRPPLENEQKKDNFVFTEAALKDFIAKDKPKSSEVDKPKQIVKDNAIYFKEKSMVSVPPVKGRPTFSLFGLGGRKPETIAVKAATPSKSVSTTANIAVAPNGVPTISKWKLDPDDNSITGLISGSASYDDGEPVTTSPIVGVATANLVVRTKSGSRYFLGEEGSKGLFSFFGGIGGVKSESAVAPAPTPLIFPTGPSSSEIAAEKKKIADKIATEKKRIEEKQAKANREALVQAQREAEKQASNDAKRKRDAQEGERRINAEKKKQIEQRQLDIDRQRQQQSLKSKQSTPKEDKISLFRFRPAEMKEEFSAPKTAVAAKKTVSAAPRGVPTINKWTLVSDNAISGIISGSSSFDDGAPVTTSPIVGSAVSGSVVQTKSGSKYFLGDELSGGGFFSLFGGGKDVSSPAPEVKAPPKKDGVTEARKEAESAKEAQRIAQAKAKIDAEKEKRQIAMEVSLNRKADVQARKQADAKAAAKREAELQARRQSEEDRKQAIEAQRLAAAAQKKLEEDEKKREAEEKKRIDLEKSERQRKMQQAEQNISKSPRGVTVSLFGFGAPKSDESSTVSTKAPTVTLQTATTAPPRGVPVISRWKQERDGSITGVITGSASLNDGDRITTSPIKGATIGGTVVTTSSGSRYYLVGSNSATLKAPDEAKVAAKKVAADKATKEAATKSEALARQKEATEKAKREKEAEAKRAKLTMKQEREDKAKRASPTLTVAGSSKSPTISLFGLGGNNEPGQVKSLAPKGVPTITGWKLNRDGSISGRIRESPNFRDGEQVTTSPIAQGRVESGSTVKTGSGSRYFLS